MTGQLAQSFTVSKVFSDKMVLQRDEIIRIWGFADKKEEGKCVRVCFGSQTCEGVIKDGAWCAQFDSVFEASGVPQVLTVSGEGCEYTFSDVLVGDVYLCIGQSNIRYDVEAIKNGAPDGYPGKDFEITDKEQIRLNRSSIHDADDNEIFPVRGTEEVVCDIRTGRSWMLPSEDGLQFSAIGYFSAHMIYQKTNGEIPIGLIEIDADGQALNAFFPNDYADRNSLDFTEDGLHKGILLGGEHSPSRYVFNHFISPFVKYAVCGIIWYQGESDFNEDNAPVYAANYTGLIENFRDKWDLKHHDIPVYMVELPPIYNLPEDMPKDTMWAYIDVGNIRGQMGRIPNMLKNSYIAASSDLWLDNHYWNSLHPYCKWPQAERLSDIILAVRYSKADINNCAGPQFEKVTYDSSRVCVKYRYTGSGLTSVNSSDIKGFEVMVNGSWIPADGVSVTSSDTVTINADAEITGVRYNCTADNYFPDKVNLSSAQGIPAISFCDIKSKD